MFLNQGNEDNQPPTPNLSTSIGDVFSMFILFMSLLGVYYYLLHGYQTIPSPFLWLFPTTRYYVSLGS